MRIKSVHGFTLVELLVVIAIMGVMLATVIPAVQASREMGRRSHCQSNLAQLMLGLQNYESTFEVFPAGVLNPDGPIRSEPVGFHQSWLVQLAPFVDEGNAYRLLDLSAGVYDPVNAAVRNHQPRVLICPSEVNEEGSSYAGCHHDVESPIAADNHGVLFLNSHLRREDLSDGAAHTLVAGEKRIELGDLGWLSGTRATLRNTGLPINHESSRMAAFAVVTPGQKDGAKSDPAAALLYVGGFASAHPDGAMVGFGDGNVKFMSDHIDLKVWQLLGHRADGKLLDGNLTD